MRLPEFTAELSLQRAVTRFATNDIFLQTSELTPAGLGSLQCRWMCAEQCAQLSGRAARSCWIECIAGCVNPNDP